MQNSSKELLSRTEASKILIEIGNKSSTLTKLETIKKKFTEWS